MLKKLNTKYSLAASIALLTFIVYLPALRNEFVYWDDNQYIFENPYIRSLDATFFRWAFTTMRMGNWNPLTWISHALDYALWGMNPLGHHLTSIILHTVNTALVVLLALKLLEIVREKDEEKASASFLNDRSVLIVAGVTGLLFGIHPVHVESVAWVSERKDLLCALFFLLSVLAYVKAVRRGEHGAEGTGQSGESKGLTPRALLSALCFFVLALMSKPMAVTLPVVLLILDWYPFERIRSWKKFWSASLEKVPFIALSLASSVTAVIAQKAGGALLSIDKIPLSVRIPVATKALVAYLGKMLLPVNLLPFYPYPRDASFISFGHLLAIVLVIGITATCVFLARKRKVWLSAWGYYVMTLLPVLGVIQVGGQSMADRYTYLPSLGPFLVAGICVAWIMGKVSTIKKQGVFGVLIITATVFVFISVSYLAMKQISVWRDSFRLWTFVIEETTEKLPMAYVNRGAAFQKKGLFDKAVADYEMAIDLDPSDHRAYISLATVLEQMGQFDRARETIEKAIALNPSSHDAFRNRGLLFEMTGQFDEAIADFSKAIALMPSYYEAYNNRGLIYAKIGKLDKAIADYNAAIATNPRHFSAYINRGVAYTLIGQFDRALEDFNRAILLGQDDSVAYYNRGMLYRRMGNDELALSDVRKACDLGNERACSALQQSTHGGNPR